MASFPEPKTALARAAQSVPTASDEVLPSPGLELLDFPAWEADLLTAQAERRRSRRRRRHNRHLVDALSLAQRVRLGCLVLAWVALIPGHGRGGWNPRIVLARGNGSQLWVAGNRNAGPAAVVLLLDLAHEAAQPKCSPATADGDGSNQGAKRAVGDGARDARSHAQPRVSFPV